MIQDFSELHTPTGALGRFPSQEQDWLRYRLRDEQVSAFHRDGFLAGVQVLERACRYSTTDRLTRCARSLRD
jgi:hypothetical protein